MSLVLTPLRISWTIPLSWRTEYDTGTSISTASGFSGGELCLVSFEELLLAAYGAEVVVDKAQRHVPQTHQVVALSKSEQIEKN